jgi:hypothetical protein
MPAVPNVPGVPKLRSYSVFSAVILIADLVRNLTGISLSQWGIYRNGIPVLIADSAVSFELRQDFPVSDYPVEAGGFQNYNKVTLPSEIKMRFVAGGSLLNRQIFLQSIEAVMNTTDLYDIVTPEKVYLGYNFTHRDLSRAANRGVGLIAVDLWLTEIRQTATATFTTTQQPGVAGPQAAGNVQPQTPSAEIQQGFGSGNLVVH